MKKILLFASLLFVLQSASAQDEAIYTHYQLNKTLINPAASGFSDAHQLHFNFRDSWTGFPDAPRTYSLSYNGPIGNVFGFGASVRTESIASLMRYRVNLAYAFLYEIEKIKFGGGFSTEFHQMRLETGATNKSALFDAGDDIIDQYNDGVMIFDAAFGVYASYNDATFIGFSFPNLVRAKLDDIDLGTDNSTFFEYFIFNFGHKFSTNENYSFTPSMLIKKIRDVPFQVDFNLQGDFLQDRLSAGVSYRTGTGGALGILLGTKINALQIFYSYDVFLERFQRYSSGSHEVTLGFEIARRKNRDRAEKFR